MGRPHPAQPYALQVSSGGNITPPYEQCYLLSDVEALTARKAMDLARPSLLKGPADKINAYNELGAIYISAARARRCVRRLCELYNGITVQLLSLVGKMFCTSSCSSVGR